MIDRELAVLERAINLHKEVIFLSPQNPIIVTSVHRSPIAPTVTLGNDEAIAVGHLNLDQFAILTRLQG